MLFYFMKWQTTAESLKKSKHGKELIPGSVKLFLSIFGLEATFSITSQVTSFSTVWTINTVKKNGRHTNMPTLSLFF